MLKKANGPRARALCEALQALRPDRVEICDESQAHRTHPAAPAGGETHLRLRIIAAAFAGHSRLQRHRMIHRAAAELWQNGLHALRITALTPQEARSPRRRPPAASGSR